MKFHHSSGLTSFSIGADPGEVKRVNFHPPFSEPPSFFFFFSYPSDIKKIFDFFFVYIYFHPPFKSPGSAPAVVGRDSAVQTKTLDLGNLNYRFKLIEKKQYLFNIGCFL